MAIKTDKKSFSTGTDFTHGDLGTSVQTTHHVQFFKTTFHNLSSYFQ